MLFYEEDTVDVGYNKKMVDVDNMMYHVFHNNHRLKFTPNDIENYVLFPYHLSAVFVKTICLCQLVKNLLIEGLVPIIPISLSLTGFFLMLSNIFVG